MQFKSDIKSPFNKSRMRLLVFRHEENQLVNALVECDDAIETPQIEITQSFM